MNRRILLIPVVAFVLGVLGGALIAAPNLLTEEETVILVAGSGNDSAYSRDFDHLWQRTRNEGWVITRTDSILGDYTKAFRIERSRLHLP